MVYLILSIAQIIWQWIMGCLIGFLNCYPGILPGESKENNGKP